MEGTWDFRLRCGVCDHEFEAIVQDASLRRLSSGGFAPLPCRECGARSAAPTVKPWALDASDRKWLRSLRITPE